MTRLQPQPIPDAQDAPLLPPLPRLDPIVRLPILILFPHSRCNCRCLMCDIWRMTTRDELAAADVASWLGEWRELGVRRVVLSGGDGLAQITKVCALHRAAPGDAHLRAGGPDGRHTIGQLGVGAWDVANLVVDRLRSIEADDHIVTVAHQVGGMPAQ